MRRLNKLHVGLAVSILLFLIAGYVILKPNAEDEPPFLSFSADIDGVKAWRELLEGRTGRVKEWRLGWSELPGTAKQALVAVQPGAISKEDIDDVLNWVKQGNDLIVLDQQPFEWSSYFPIAPANETTNKADSTAEKKANPTEPPLGEDQAETIIRQGDEGPAPWTGVVQTAFRLKPVKEQKVLLSDGQGVLASRTAVGSGHITMVLTPEWITNERILKHSHFELLWPLFAEPWSTVWIDETHHGYGTTRGLPAVYPAWLKLAAMQLGLALLAWLWLRGKRFGPVYTPRAWTVRRGDETLLAVAGWYERLGCRDEALAHQQLHLRQLLLERWGLSPSASAQQAAEAARSRWPEPQAARLARLLEPPALPGGTAAGAGAGAGVGVGESESPQAQRGASTAKQFVERTREMGEMIAYLEKE